MYKAKVYITLRKSILDPKGKATLNALHSLGFDSIEETRIGKYIELKLSASSDDEARAMVKEASEKLLANMVMEDFTFELEKI
jgi:phosphoribosylformylglycinamidine synthase